jgi:hypothetical protein
MSAKVSGEGRKVRDLRGVFLDWLGINNSIGKEGIVQLIMSVASRRAGARRGEWLALFLGLSPMAQAQLVCWPVSAGGNGHYYEAVVSPGINWYEASNVATNKRGYLATITSREENAFVYSMIRTNAALWDRRPTGNSWGPWIGGFQPPGSLEPDGGWCWVTGEPFVYANWCAGEPNNNHGTEDRIHFWGEQADVGEVWNDRPASDGVEGLVIEYETHPDAVRLAISMRGTNELQVAWPSRVNVHYTVERSEELASYGWDTLTNVVGTGGPCYASDRRSNMRGFYRVLSSP